MRLSSALLPVVLLSLWAGCAAPARRQTVAPTPVEVAAAAKKVPWRPFPGVENPSTVATSGAVTLVCVGDLMFGRRVEQARMVREQEDPFEAVTDILNDGDITAGNLECVLGNTKDFKAWKPYDKIYLPAPKVSAERLKTAGFELLTIGNNHILDFGVEGLKSTLAILRSQGLSSIGTWDGSGKPNAPAVLEVRGRKVAFLGYSDVSPPYFAAKGADQPGTIPPLSAILKRDIPAARQMADFVVVQVHWGDEYKEEPTDRQVMLAHLMADLGADAVVGHHPHILQRVERYKKTLIAYSLGNFLFDLRKAVSFPSMALRLTLDAGRPTSAEFVPIWLGAMFPRPAKNDEWEKFPSWMVPSPTPVAGPSAVP